MGIPTFSYRYHIICNKYRNEYQHLFATMLQLYIFAEIMIMASYKSWWDRIGAGAAFICMVHCVILPLFTTTLSLFGLEIIENTKIEVLLLAISFLAGSFAIIHGYLKHHQRKDILIAFVAGFLLLLFSAFLLNGTAEMLAKVSSASIIIFSHFQNWIACRNCKAGLEVGSE